MRRYAIFLASLLLILSLAGCGKKVTPQHIEDNPAHHYLMGMELIDQGQPDKAFARFERAVVLDDEYAPAIAGKALVYAMRAEAESDDGYKSADSERAIDQLDKAVSEAGDKDTKFRVYVTGIRVYTHLASRGWLSRAEDLHHDAKAMAEDVQEDNLIYYRNTEAVDYFMGVAFFKGGEFRKSEDALGVVLAAAPGKWHEKARELSRRVQKIVLAMRNYTLTDVAKKIAVKETVDRADVAALLVDELHLDRLFAGRIPVLANGMKAEFVPADVVNHMFEPEIMTVLKWKVRGLEPAYDQKSQAFLFYPNKAMTRKELAFVLEDVLIKLTGDESMSSQHLGQSKSLYPDVSPTGAWYNAIVTVVNRNLMETELSGEFRPDANMDGADLILSLMRLRNVMNIY
ncbi:S-layer homology domain-containing protein [Maridesulfovibrio ferrireducens]|uniref:S-layer homology domain-containing protein n=1 Tax=Maridesulfovibrio ferrireducens TaxID=246191 RepID=A0A1G9H172_9BACT|nr:S-layer homology domain-containing protein [Maridesulfovibrio ferrireducens]SDL06564.1 S-layer homology domain-containing protein [Maridesulfovibrio ferrireducens]